MQMAGILLTGAKAACVGAKLICDSSCAAAVATLKSLSAKQLKMDQSVTRAAAIGRRPDLAQFPASIKTSLLEESNPATPGSPVLAADKCSKNMKDIMALGANALGMFMSSQNAKECAKKLASQAQTGDAGVTPEQWCQKPENTKLEFCKCRLNPQQQGCPGAVAAAGQNTAGSNIRPVAGRSSFGGGSGSNGLGSADLGNVGSTNESGTAGAKTDLNLANGSPSGVTGGGFGGSLGGGSSADTNTAKGSDGKLPDKKKWDYSSFGSSGSGGSSRSGNSKFASNGSLSGDQQMAVERKIASDKFAAQVSSASGKSNWEKIRNMYLMKENTFGNGQ
jgi:hypothetical protein